MTTELNRAFQSIMFDTERNLFRDATGLLAQGDGAYSVTGTTIQLANPLSRAHLFRKGMEIGSTLNATSTPRTGRATITGMNRALGQLTTDAPLNSQISGVTNADWLFAFGDYKAANDKRKIYGAEEWCPATPPTSGDNHFGVDRSQDVELLAGTRYGALGKNLDEALTGAQAEGSAIGCMPRVCFMNYKNVAKLINLLGAKKEYKGRIQAQGPDGPLAEIGFDTIQVWGPESVIDVLSHPLVDENVTWLVDPDELVFLAMGEYPSIIDDDDNQLLRVYNDNSVEARVGGYPQLATGNPGGAIVRIDHTVA